MWVIYGNQAVRSFGYGVHVSTAGVTAFKQRKAVLDGNSNKYDIDSGNIDDSDRIDSPGGGAILVNLAAVSIFDLVKHGRQSNYCLYHERWKKHRLDYIPLLSLKAVATCIALSAYPGPNPVIGVPFLSLV